jgi:hypothetical protein
VSYKQAEMRREARFYAGLMIVVVAVLSALAGAVLAAAGVVSRSFVVGYGAGILILLVIAYFNMRPAVMQDGAIWWVHPWIRAVLSVIFWKW